MEEAWRAKASVEKELADMKEVHGKLEATAAALRATQEGAASELVEQQVCPFSRCLAVLNTH